MGMGWLSSTSSKVCLVGTMIQSRLHRQPPRPIHHHHTRTQEQDLHLPIMGVTCTEDHMHLELVPLKVLVFRLLGGLHLPLGGPHLLHQVCTRPPRHHTPTSTQHSLTTAPLIIITLITHLQHTQGNLSTEHIQLLTLILPLLILPLTQIL